MLRKLTAVCLLLTYGISDVPQASVITAMVKAPGIAGREDERIRSFCTKTPLSVPQEGTGS